MTLPMEMSEDGLDTQRFADLLPLPNCTCPNCGRPNDCVPANTGTFDVECWCANVSIGREALTAIAATSAGPSCICSACAERLAAGVPPDR